MDYQIIQVNENTWRIEEEGVRFFLLAGKERALLIDSGMQVHDARTIAESLTPLPVALLNTHADMDHLGSIGQFDEFYMHPAEAANYHGTGKLIPVEDGDVLDLGGRSLRVIHLPGHTEGSIAVLDTAGRVLISGDPVQAHGRIFMFGEHRNMETYIKSLEKLSQMAAAFDEIWPSHADIPVKPDVIGELLAGAKDVVNGAVAGHEVEMFGHRAMAYDIGVAVLLCDL